MLPLVLKRVTNTAMVVIDAPEGASGERSGAKILLSEPKATMVGAGGMQAGLAVAVDEEIAAELTGAEKEKVRERTVAK